MLRSLRAERLLAFSAAAVGVLGIVSAATPEMADRVRLMRGVLPPGWPEGARILTMSCAIGLIFLARSLARRRRRAWQLAILVVIASATAHLAKGLDIEEAAISLAFLVALIHWRGRFDVPGNTARVRFGLGLAALAGGIAAVAIAASLRGADLPNRAADSLTAVGIVAGFAALYFWLRPFGQAVAQSVGERRVARTLVETYGTDSLSFFALRRDKSYLFSPTRKAFLAYRVVAGTALMSGDPVGEESEVDALLDELKSVARAHGWRLAIVGASEYNLPRYRALGLKPIPMGEEAVLRPAEFSLEGRAIRKVRQSVSRLQKAGYSFRVVAADDVSPELEEELADVSAAWRGDQPERGFSMTIDDLHVPGTVLAIAADEHGTIGGFLHLAPSPAGGGWSLSTMRRRPHSPNGLTEYLIVETVEWAKAEGASELSLNFCAFTDVISPERATTIPKRLARRVLLLADNVFQLERLYSFNRKFFPEWRRRYICVERYADIPAVGLAYLHAESLLVPPGPWTRRREARRRIAA
ncbi:MAG: lysyl-tRNA synthetase, class [Gaiellaceae bacterium]|jgi:lysyl-tRNA synthetase class 2|nr:lysyl-tRNA synthetase, class [Gaiellaceae bacterium]